jgi:hypothetical protein
MQRFLAKPTYTRADLTQLLNAYEDRLCGRGECRCAGKIRSGTTCRGCHLHRRKAWNRKNTRKLLLDLGLESRAPEGRTLTYTLEQLNDVAPDLVRSMVLIDEFDDARDAA